MKRRDNYYIGGSAEEIERIQKQLEKRGFEVDKDDTNQHGVGNLIKMRFTKK